MEYDVLGRLSVTRVDNVDVATLVGDVLSNESIDHPGRRTFGHGTFTTNSGRRIAVIDGVLFLSRLAYDLH